MNPKFSQVRHITKRFQKIFNFFSKMMTSAIVTSSIFLSFTHIQHGFYTLKIIQRKKTGKSVKDKPFSFQKMKTEFKNLALIRFYC